MQENQDDTLISQPPATKESGLSPGTVIGDRYQIVSLIGSGGMGTVYRVSQILLGKDFALKVLDLHSRNDVSERRFRQEARTASQLQHPNLVEVHDFGVLGDEQPYLVMDLVEGETLAEVLNRKFALPIDYVVVLGIQICFGLMYAHDKGVVHRDIKPGNIMLLHPDRDATEGTVKLVDFGIAKLTQSEDGEIQTLTRTGEIFGSPIYMSPEQCKGAAVDRRSDIYSLGCVIFECLTGVPPFRCDNAMSTMLKRLSDDPPSFKVASGGREFPAVLENIVRKMLAVNPEDRYQHLGAVVKDLMVLKRPDDGVMVSSGVKEIVSKKKASPLITVLLAGVVAVTSVLATAAFDRLFLYPALSPFKSDSKVGDLESELAELPGLSKDYPKDTPPSKVTPPTAASQTGASPATASATASQESAPDLFDEDPNSPLADYEPAEKSTPILETKTVSSGEVRQRIIFPENYGTITVNNVKRPARGIVQLPPNALISIKLNRTASTNLNVFKNIGGLSFHRLELGGYDLFRNKCIEPLAKAKRLEQIDLGICGITSLKPLYNNTTLTQLELGGSKVSSAEILKMKRLMNLRMLDFGPVKDPLVVIQAVAKSKFLNNLGYRGSRFKEDTIAQGLNEKDVAALSKLTQLRTLTIERCPEFNDESLKQLLTLKNLHQLKIKDCALTAKSIPTFQKFKYLQELPITTEGWSKHDIKVLEGLMGPKFVRQKTRGQRIEERIESVNDVGETLRHFNPDAQN